MVPTIMGFDRGYQVVNHPPGRFSPPAGRTGMTKKNQGQLTRHPLAEELFGNLESHEFEGLKHGIRQDSQGARVWLYQGRVLCGWHTHLACKELGIEPENV